MKQLSWLAIPPEQHKATDRCVWEATLEKTRAKHETAGACPRQVMTTPHAKLQSPAQSHMPEGSHFTHTYNLRAVVETTGESKQALHPLHSSKQTRSSTWSTTTRQHGPDIHATPLDITVMSHDINWEFSQERPANIPGTCQSSLHLQLPASC
mmetsp:Transcript_4043/g.10921  ORF Transcript_4043/g.10921 Transcript_4043/m.10921 type:complete len:153 (-) Transcript_4043:2200-2658(-)